MNGSGFLKGQVNDWEGFEILARTPMPQLPPLQLPPLHHPPPTPPHSTPSHRISGNQEIPRQSETQITWNRQSV